MFLSTPHIFPDNKIVSEKNHLILVKITGQNTECFKEKLVKTYNIIKKTRTVGNTVLAQSVGLDILLQESYHNFGIVHRQVLLSKVARQKNEKCNFLWN